MGMVRLLDAKEVADEMDGRVEGKTRNDVWILSKKGAKSLVCTFLVISIEVHRKNLTLWTMLLHVTSESLFSVHLLT